MMVNGKHMPVENTGICEPKEFGQLWSEVGYDVAQKQGSDSHSSPALRLPRPPP